MDSKKALEILIQSAQIAVKRGAFELGETRIIADAVDVFTKPQEPKEKGVKEDKPKKTKKK